MIQTERIGDLIRTWSDRGVYIHGGFPEADYTEAYDPVEREYTETDVPIDTEETEAEAILRILMGGAV